MENVVSNAVDTVKDSLIIGGTYAISSTDNISVSNSNLLVFVGVTYTVFRIFVLITGEIRSRKEHKIKMQAHDNSISEIKRIQKENEILKNK
jgi:hypothetical protein